MTVTPGSIFEIGSNTTINDRSVFEIGIQPRGVVKLGSNIYISHDFHLQCNGWVTLGDDVLVGEFVSIRDTTHQFNRGDIPIREHTDVTGFVKIENDVWIGRGSLIQAREEGIIIGRGSIIGANSLVNRSIPPMEVWAGSPAKLIKKRMPDKCRIGIVDE